MWVNVVAIIAVYFCSIETELIFVLLLSWIHGEEVCVFLCFSISKVFARLFNGFRILLRLIAVRVFGQEIFPEWYGD